MELTERSRTRLPYIAVAAGEPPVNGSCECLFDRLNGRFTCRLHASDATFSGRLHLFFFFFFSISEELRHHVKFEGHEMNRATGSTSMFIVFSILFARAQILEETRQFRHVNAIPLCTTFCMNAYRTALVAISRVVECSGPPRPEHPSLQPRSVRGEENAEAP